MIHYRPRGVRACNPGNIEHSDIRWQGMAMDQSSDDQMVTFINPLWGIRAVARMLISYQDRGRTGDDRVDIVRGTVERWMESVARGNMPAAQRASTTLDKWLDDEKIDVYDFDTMYELTTAIILCENAPGPLPGGRWYARSLIIDGLVLAGILEGVQHGGAEHASYCQRAPQTRS